jgi:hypothetical protein
MTQKTDLNVSPYYDDFDEEKNFQNILFRPGFAVQARELSQIQSLLKNKISTVGDHLFKDGAMVVPGQLSYVTGLFMVRVQTTFSGEDVNLSQFVNETKPVIITGATSGVSAKVFAYAEATTTQPAKLYVQFIGGKDTKLDSTSATELTKVNRKFSVGESFSADVSITHTSEYNANIISLTGETAEQIKLKTATEMVLVRPAVKLEAGIYYIRGTFVNVEEKLVVLESIAGSNSRIGESKQHLYTGRIGLKIKEEVVTPEIDSSLLDNSTGSSNFAAKGAHRLKITATIHAIPLESTDDSDFVELMRTENSVVVDETRRTEFGAIEQTMARRTFDESGNYTVRPFTFEVSESVTLNDNIGYYTDGQKTSDRGIASTSKLALKLSPGKAYVSGYEIEQISTRILDIDKAREFNTVNAGVSTFNMGNYAKITKIYGSPDVDFVSGETTAYKVCKLYNTRTATRGTAAGTLIGAARVRTMSYDSGTAGSTSSNATSKYRLFLFDIRPFTKLTLSGTPSATLIANHTAGGVQVKGVTSKATGWVFAEGTSSTNVNLTNVSGTFSAGEKITASDSTETDDIVENSSNADLTISSLVSYTFADVKQIYMQDTGADSGQDFTCDVSLDSTLTISGTYRTETSGTDNLIGVSGYDTSQVKIGDVVTIPTGTAGATEERIVDAVTATAISFTAAPTTDAITTSSIIRNRAKLYDTEKNLSIIKLPKSTVKTHLTGTNNGASDSQYTLRKQFVGTTNSSGVVTLSAGTSETFAGFAEGDYTMSILTAGGGSGVQGDVVTLTGKTSGTGSGTLTITDSSILGSSAKVKILATLLKTSVGAKTKTTKLMKQLKVIEGDTHAYGTRPTDQTISLGRADVFKLVAVYDSESTSADAVAPEFQLTDTSGTFIKGERITGGTTGAAARIIDISTPMNFVQTSVSSFAVAEIVTGEKSGAKGTISSVTTGSTVITTRYVLDTGQRDNYYDIGRLERKPGSPAPTGRLLVVHDYLEHGAGAFFTVDSYSDIANQMTYEDIPTYSASKIDPDLPKPSGEFPLYDVFDFRPRCEDITGAVSSVDVVDEITGNSFDITNRQFDGTGSSTTHWPKPNSTVQSDFEYYLPRYDLVHMDKNGTLIVTKGISSEIPEKPKEPDQMMKLCEIALPAYTFTPQDVGITREKNQRFTMRDIGKLQDRVENLEYYTSLSLLERDAESFEVTDSNGLNRFKSGFIVDNFTGHKVGDTQHPDYKVSIDGINNTLRPMHCSKGVDLEESVSSDTDRTSAHYQKTGDLITLPYTEVVYTEQPYATRVERVQPVMLSQWLGRITLSPDSDNWFETEVAPALVINVEGNYSTLLNENKDALGTIWNAWQTQWSGVVATSTTSNDVFDGQGGITRNSRTTSTTRSDLTRTGVNTQVLEKIDRESQGSKIIQRAMIPFCRSKEITFDGEGFYPNTRMYLFFAEKAVSLHVKPKEAQYSDGSVNVPIVGSPLITNGAGKVEGVFTIPDPRTLGNLRFQTGEVSFRLTSSQTNDRATKPITAGESIYYAKGILETEQETIIATRNAEVVRRGTNDTTSITESSTSSSSSVIQQPFFGDGGDGDGGDDAGDDGGGDDGGDGGGDDGDPLAQTFAVQNNKENKHYTTGALGSMKGGQFVTSLDIFFFSKDDVLPTWVEIRTTENGYPGGKIMPFGRAYVQAADVLISDDATVATKFTFPSPVFLKPDTEYCFVVFSHSIEYKIWISRMGEREIGKTRHVSKQPHLGVHFKSHNNTGWSISLTEDIKYKLNVARFDDRKDGKLTLQNKTLPSKTLPANPLIFTTGSAVLRVLHKNHHMYNTTNNVTLSGVKSGASTTLNGAITSSSASLVLLSGTNFDDTTGRYRYNSSSEWYIKINDEIIKYTTISGTNVSNVTRAQGSTNAVSHADGSTVEFYSLHGVPLTEVNKTFSSISNIGMDSYTLALSTSTPTIGGSGVASNGGTTVLATENAIYNVSDLLCSTMALPDTTISTKMRGTSGTSPSGVESSFSLTATSDAITIPLEENFVHDITRMICSPINETTHLGGSKSLNIDMNLHSDRENLSPVIDLSRTNFVAVANRLNNIDSSSDVYPTTDYVALTGKEGDQNAAIYMTKRVTLENPATAIKVFFSGYRHSTSEIKVLYKILRTDDASNFDDLGWTMFNGTADPDVTTPSSLTQSDLREYVYTAGVTDDGIGTELDSFIQFAIKVVLQGTNSAQPPRIKDFRALALAT